MAFDFMILEGTPKRSKASKNVHPLAVVQQTRNFLQGAAEPPTPPFFKTSTPTKLTLCTSPNYLHTTDDSELHEKSTVSTNVNNRAGFSPTFSPNGMTSSDSKSSGVKSNVTSVKILITEREK
uniref:Uncharacterized protein n=1 Tax=Romanomermis culicivorax TaxID=13658 RepID=A0A915KLL7_ROMCU